MADEAEHQLFRVIGPPVACIRKNVVWTFDFDDVENNSEIEPDEP